MSFVVVFDKTKARESGYYPNGYLVDIPYKKAQNVYRRKIKVAGKVSIAKAVNPNAKDKVAGWDVDMKLIINPTVEVIW